MPIKESVKASCTLLTVAAFVLQPFAALARLGLARAYAMQGNTAKACAAYQDFLTLWKAPIPTSPS
jgi:cytochrome c-type biogenesis protein CcmH/NrfG